MRTKVILLLISVPMIIFGQKQEKFSKLIEKINHSLLEYNKLSPFGSSYYPIDGFGLSKQEIKKIIADADYDGILSVNKDSIQEYYMIVFFQGEIEAYLDKIIEHPDFLKNDIANLIKGNVLSIVKSDDNKLLNISFDEKTGGSYRSQISKMYYINTETGNTINISDSSVVVKDVYDKYGGRIYSSLAKDGYNQIYTLQTTEETKYVLTGFVRGCNYCFETFVQLLNFSEGKIIEEFMYSINTRYGNDGVEYDHENKTIYANYSLNDLTPICYCSGAVNEEEYFSYDNQKLIYCKCKFVFNGENFELVESHWEKKNEKNLEEE